MRDLISLGLVQAELLTINDRIQQRVFVEARRSVRSPRIRDGA